MAELMGREWIRVSGDEELAVGISPVPHRKSWGLTLRECRPNYGVVDVLAWFPDEATALKAIEVLSKFIKARPADEEPSVPQHCNEESK